jgi:hypothetical protein
MLTNIIIFMLTNIFIFRLQKKIKSSIDLLGALTNTVLQTLNLTGVKICYSIKSDLAKSKIYSCSTQSDSEPESQHDNGPSPVTLVYFDLYSRFCGWY